MKEPPAVEVLDRVIHGDNVLRRHIGHNVMRLLKDETAAGCEECQLLLHVLMDFRGRRLRQDCARVTATAPKAKPGAEIPFQPRRVHAGASDLDGVDRGQDSFTTVIEFIQRLL